MSEEETRTLRVRDRQGTFEVTIPSDWKVTFGAFQSGKYDTGSGPALRIYEAENKQRACFIGVVSFYDTSLPIQREIVLESGETTWEQGIDGNSKTTKTKTQKVQVDF